MRLPIANFRLPIDRALRQRRLPIGNRQSAIGNSAAFTLIELILILAVLAITASLIVPRLAEFFRGRTLDSETRQILALMHHGQSRAVSAGVPMVLWLDEAEKTYGLEEEPGYSDKDPDALEFRLDQELQFEIQKPDATAAHPLPATGTSSGPRAGLPSIRFLPDGSIAETSPRTLKLVDRNGSAVLLTQSRDRTQYEIQAPTNQWTSANW
jgi:type II secretory pathway pseudopilin PulG